MFFMISAIILFFSLQYMDESNSTNQTSTKDELSELDAYVDDTDWAMRVFQRKKRKKKKTQRTAQ